MAHLATIQGAAKSNRNAHTTERSLPIVGLAIHWFSVLTTSLKATLVDFQFFRALTAKKHRVDQHQEQVLGNEHVTSPQTRRLAKFA